MSKALSSLADALDAVATAVLTGWTGDQTFCEAWGWNCAAVTRHEAAAVATSLAEEIRAAKIESVDKETVDLINRTRTGLGVLQAQTIPQLWGGNNSAAYAAYVATIQTIRAALSPHLGWKTIPDPKTLPPHLTRKLKAIDAELDNLLPEKTRLAAQIEEISEAHSVAENLPIDLKALGEARAQIDRQATEAGAAAIKVSEALEEVAERAKLVAEHETNAAKLVSQCEEAYRITTTKGLAAAFDQRATALGWSVRAWAGGLLLALGAGSMVGAHRLADLTEALKGPSLEWHLIALHLSLSVLAVGAPIWFAWLATKQIGQRFRLSEDYAFKASVAKAYEGYRKEAARLDPDFESRLFSSALSRLDEAPLRLIEEVAHGSPWQEILASPTAKSVVEAVPALGERAAELARDVVAAVGKKVKPAEAEKGAE